MAKGKGNVKGNVKAKLKIQKGGNFDASVSCPSGYICTDNTVVIIIILFILAVAGMFIYFKYYDKPVQVIIQQPAQPAQQVQSPQPNQQESTTVTEKLIVGDIPVQVPSEVQYLVNKEQERLINPLLPPERTYVLTNGSGLPVYKNSINTPTRGFTGAFQQVGLLYKKDPSGESNNEGNILPLFGRPTNTSRDKWYYYTTSDKFHSLKIPIKIKGRICNDEWGCNELYDDDTVEVGPYNGQFKVQIYGYDSPKYLPVAW
jgi:hypothetical protein